MKKNTISQNLCFGLFGGFVALALLVFGYLYGYCAFAYTITCDEWEHLQASWMTAHGMVPFRDFFEHHHALLWYLTVPFVSGNPDLSVFWGLRFVILLTFVANCGWIWGITKQLNNQKYTPFLAVFFYVSCYITITEFADFRPDHFMICGLLGGIYFLIKYLQRPKCVDLCVCALLFFVAFCFLQKVIVFFVPLSVVFLLLLADKRILWKDFLVACIAPVLLTFAYVGYLYITDSLTDYFELNWLLNKAWFRDYEHPLPLLGDFYVWAGLFVAVALTLKSKDWVQKSFFALVVLYFAVWYVFPKPYHTYYLALIPFLAIALGVFIRQYLLAGRVKCLIGFLICLNLLIDGAFHFTSRLMAGGLVYQQEKTYILGASKPDDQVVSFASAFYVPFHKPVSYYWFGLGRGALWDNMLFQRHPLPDLNQEILDKKPRFVRMGIIYNNQYTANDATEDILYEPDKEVINKYYRKTRYNRIYERKPNLSE